MAESLTDSGIRANFLADFLSEAGIKNRKHVEHVKAYFDSFSDNKAMVDKMMAGLRREELDLKIGNSLVDRVELAYPFIIDPMPNLYFTRDPFSTIGNGIALNRMRTETRRRETLFSNYIFKHHPLFKDADIPFWYNRTDRYAIEGGDVLILNENIICVGISERTDADAIERLARNIFSDGQPFKTILAFDIPKIRAFMHLDTVFTMVDHNIFTIHPEIEGPLTVYSLTRSDVKGQFVIHKERESLENILKKYLEVDEIKLIRCGGKRGIDAGREQWNDGSNTRAIAPGEVIVYGRNHVTNELLEEEGVKLHVIPSSELSRGRGGPRCMSMPLYRELIK